jgi:hypothetical protein
MLTDYALGAAGLYFAFQLWRIMRPANRRPIRLWVLGYLGSAIAALTGGTFHGFALVLSPSSLRALWNVTMIAIGAGSAFMVGGILATSIRKTDESRAWLKRGLVITLAGFAVQLTGFRHGLDFNHNDLFHVIQIAGLYFFYRGARLLTNQ